MAADDHTPSPNELLFLQLVSMFEVAAMQQMGKLLNPVTGKSERDLEQAKVSIDILDLIQAKTQGNLTAKEKEFLDKALFELHMNYVDEAESAKKEPVGEKKEDDAEGAGPDSPAGDEEDKKTRPEPEAGEKGDTHE